MNEERIKELLSQADRAAGQPAFGPLPAARIRRRVHPRRLVRIAVPTAVAATIALAAVLGALSLPMRKPQPARIASLEEQVRQLQAQTQTTLKLVQDVLERDR